jgi:hypothetical protein
MKTRTTRIKLGLAILTLGACAVSPADAQSGINVLNSQYTTYVMVQGTNGESGTTAQAGDFELWPWGNSRMTVSPAPISDEMYAPVSGLLSAQAGTETFGVSAYSSMGGLEHEVDAAAGAHNATAGAESEIWFSPTTSGTANIELDFAVAYNWEYSAGSVSLIDLTSSQTLWNYGWYLLSGTVPWSSPYGGSGVATLALETDFKATDSYALTMYTQTFSDYDAEQVSIQLSGLEVAPGSPAFVPEPSTFVLVGLGVMFLLTLNRHARQMSARHINVIGYKSGLICQPCSANKAAS